MHSRAYYHLLKATLWKPKANIFKSISARERLLDLKMYFTTLFLLNLKPMYNETL